MDGKVIVVTGASGALGKVVVERAIFRGARVAAVDHASTPQAASGPDRLEIGGVDLSDPAQAGKAIDAAAAHFGRLDGLINVAGGFAYEAVADGHSQASPNQNWEKMHRLNLLTALNACRSAIPYLVKSGAGRIVNIGAMGALHAAAGMGPYAASKAGVHRLTETLAAELKGKVTVNAVLPSTIDTPANRASMPDADFGQWVTAQELANVILFLASDEASAVTGALLPVSGRV
jgi:NAD(P)-dependent dehydrogenase (short-subunit alcohol dehydrogenase family)